MRARAIEQANSNDLIRVHRFVSISKAIEIEYSSMSSAWQWLATLLISITISSDIPEAMINSEPISEELSQGLILLKFPYRLILRTTGDLGGDFAAGTVN